MGRVIGKVISFMFYALLVVVFLFTASLTFDLLRKILPNDAITPVFGLALFDIGALIWILTFLKKAKGLGQRAVCLIGFLFDFACSIIMVIADLFMAGQTLATIPDFLKGETIVWVVGAAAAINLAIGYLFHVLDPESAKEIEMQTEVDTLADEGLKEAKKLLREQKPELAQLIAGDLFNQALDMLRMHQTSTGIVLDGNAREVGAVEPIKARVYNQETPLYTPPPTPPIESLPTCSMCHKEKSNFVTVDGKLVCTQCANKSDRPNA